MANCNVNLWAEIGTSNTDGKWYYYTSSCNTPISVIIRDQNDIILYAGDITPSNIPLVGNHNIKVEFLGANISVPCIATFYYVIGGTPNNYGSCGAQSMINIELLPEISSGTVVQGPLQYCDYNNMLVNLYDLIEGETFGGVWTDESDNVLDPPLIVPSNFAPGSYVFTYTVDNSSNALYTLDPTCNCEKSTNVTITILDGFNAGTGLLNAVCE